MKILSPTREAKIKNAIAYKQPNLTVIFDNVTDPHNIFAAIRTADAVGLIEIYTVNTGAQFTKKLKQGKRSGSGSKKWIVWNEFSDYESCFKAVRSKYTKVYGTALGEASQDLYSLDLTQSVALVFGNEQHGISKEALQYCDGHFIIPQGGMIESLNISVACAVSLYEAYRQRKNAGMYDEKSLMTEEMKQEMMETWRNL